MLLLLLVLVLLVLVLVLVLLQVCLVVKASSSSSSSSRSKLALGKHVRACTIGRMERLLRKLVRLLLLLLLLGDVPGRCHTAAGEVQLGGRAGYKVLLRRLSTSVTNVVE